MISDKNDKDAALSISWHDSAWIPILSPANVLDYFSERTNPFYDRTCNNEVIKMQRLHTDQLQNMPGIEFILLHIQEPILYVVRKQQRHSPTNVVPLADYYIIAGVVYQAPDLFSVINSRLLNTVFSLESAFEEAYSYSRYHASRGYWWEFKDKSKSESIKPKEKKPATRKKEEPSSLFQRQRVDMLLAELAKKYPPKMPQMVPAEKAVAEELKAEVKVEIKQEKLDDKDSVQTSVSVTTSAVAAPPTSVTTATVSTTATGAASSSAVSSAAASKPPPEKKAKLR